MGRCYLHLWWYYFNNVYERIFLVSVTLHLNWRHWFSSTRPFAHVGACGDSCDLHHQWAGRPAHQQGAQVRNANQVTQIQNNSEPSALVGNPQFIIRNVMCFYPLCVLKCLLKSLKWEETKSHLLHFLGFHHCAFSNVSSNGLPERMHSHIGYICLTFLHYVFLNVSANCLRERMQSHMGRSPQICTVFLCVTLKKTKLKI